MDAFETVRDLIVCELEEVSRTNKMEPNLAHYIGELVDIIKDIDEIEMKEGIYEEEYSQRYPMYYEDGNSYRNGMRNVGRSYGNRGGYSGRRYGGRGGSRGGMYSRDDSKMHIIDKLEDVMNQTTDDSDKAAIQRLIDKMENG